MNDGRTRTPDQGAQPGFGSPVTDPLAPPVTGPLDGAPAPPVAPVAPGVQPKPIVVTRPMAAHPLPSPAPGAGAVGTHRATQMSASVGIPSTLESPKDAMLLLRAEAQTRIERPMGSAGPSGVPSTLEDVDSTMPDNAARDAAIRDAAREADERAAVGSQNGSKRFGPPTLQSPNDGALPSSNAPSIGGAVVDAILPSAAFVRPEPPPTTPTQGSGPPPLPPAWNLNRPAAGFAAGRVVQAPGAPGVGPRGPTVPDDAWPAKGATPGLAQTGGQGSGSGVAYFPGGKPPAGGSGAPGGYGQSAGGPAPTSQPAGVPAKRSGAAVAIAVAIVLAVVAVIAVVAIVFLTRSRGGSFPLGATSPSVSAPSTVGSTKGK